MARLIGPDEASREVKTIVAGAFRSKAGRPAQLWVDQAATVPADVLDLDGSAVSASTVTVDEFSMLPLVQFPDDVDVLFVTCDGGPAWPVYARTDDRLDALAAAVAAGGGGGGGSSLAHPGFTFTVRRSGSTYTAYRADGTVAATSADSASPLRSGLRTVLAAVAADNTSIYFPAGVYTFPEDPAGAEDHWAPNGISGLTVEGDPSRSSILANWRDDSQPGYDSLPDVEPLSFTRCHDLTYRNFRVWAGGNQDANNSSDALDFDGCRGTHVEGIIVERSRARGIVYDGGDTGAVSRNSHVIGCEVRGVPATPSIFGGPAGTLTAQEYRYVVTYVDSAFGETPPSEVASFKPSGTEQARLVLSPGPAYSASKGVTGRKVYRWSTAQPTFRLLATLDNTATAYNDNATDASIAAAATVPLTGVPLVPKEGIKLLGSSRHLVTNNEVLAVGSHGVQVVRKGSDAASNANANGHRIIGNTVRRAGAGTGTAGVAGVFIGGGSYCVVQGNNISNVGTVAAQGHGVVVQGLLGASTEYNAVGPNVVYDDQDANTPAGGATTKHGVLISIAGGGAAPDNTVLVPGAIRGMVTSAVNDLSGTNTRQFSETTHTHPGASGAPVTIGWKAGNYYGARSSMAHGTIAGQALTLNQLFASPMFVPDTVTVTTIACNVTAAVAGAKLRMGIYTVKSDGRPNTLVVGSETGDISAATTGDKTGTISAALTGGQWYWLAVISDQAISVNGFTGGQPNVLGSAGPGSGTKASGVRASTGVWTTLPATFPAPTDSAITLTTEVTF